MGRNEARLGVRANAFYRVTWLFECRLHNGGVHAKSWRSGYLSLRSETENGVAVDCVHRAAFGFVEASVLEILKLLVTLLSGGACGALINELLHRRRARMQPIPLIERVNRLVSSELKGFVLARRPGTGGESQELEVVEKVREYQFTLQNSSYIHLHNAEIQFEFPSKDVEGRAERPGRSKTTPVQLESEVSEPWKAGYRWRIPEFPPGDSIEFTFRAVGSSSAEYEVAIYNGGQVVIERSRGEPAARRVGLIWAQRAWVTFFAALTVCWIFMIYRGVSGRTREETTVVGWAGCSLIVRTSLGPENYRFFSFSQPSTWNVDSSIMNTGPRKCFLKWETPSKDGFTIDSGDSVSVGGGYTNTKPKLVPVGLLFGPDSPRNSATVMLYLRDNP